jgi:hypothetical protein
MAPGFLGAIGRLTVGLDTLALVCASARPNTSRERARARWVDRLAASVCDEEFLRVALS